MLSFDSIELHLWRQWREKFFLPQLLMVPLITDMLLFDRFFVFLCHRERCGRTKTTDCSFEWGFGQSKLSRHLGQWESSWENFLELDFLFWTRISGKKGFLKALCGSENSSSKRIMWTFQENINEDLESKVEQKISDSNENQQELWELNSLKIIFNGIRSPTVEELIAFHELASFLGHHQRSTFRISLTTLSLLSQLISLNEFLPFYYVNSIIGWRRDFTFDMITYHRPI